MEPSDQHLLRAMESELFYEGQCGSVGKGQSNLRLLLARFALVGKEYSPCGSHSSATSIAAQQNR